jgi:hypothetical protein
MPVIEPTDKIQRLYTAWKRSEIGDGNKSAYARLMMQCFKESGHTTYSEEFTQWCVDRGLDNAHCCVECVTAIFDPMGNEYCPRCRDMKAKSTPEEWKAYSDQCRIEYR